MVGVMLEEHLNDLTLMNMEKKVVMSVMSDGKDERLHDLEEGLREKVVGVVVVGSR